MTVAPGDLGTGTAALQNQDHGRNEGRKVVTRVAHFYTPTSDGSWDVTRCRKASGR